MKGQFFIISTVIMISAMIMITNYLYDYGKVDMTQVEQMQELNYIEDVEQVLRETIKISCDPDDNNLILYANLIATKNSLEKSFLEKGISFTINFLDEPSCIFGTDIEFTIDSQKFHIVKSFSS